MWYASPLVCAATLAIMLPALLVSPQSVASSVIMLKGRVNIAGSIIHSACAVVTGDADQTIDLSAIPLFQPGAPDELPHKREGHLLAIHLVNCLQEQKNGQFRMTFDGDHDGRHFTITGTADTVLQIRDRHGNTVRPGVAHAFRGIPDSDIQQAYSLRLVSHRAALFPAGWHTTIRIRMDYD